MFTSTFTFAKGQCDDGPDQGARRQPPPEAHSTLLVRLRQDPF